MVRRRSVSLATIVEETTAERRRRPAPLEPGGGRAPMGGAGGGGEEEGVRKGRKGVRDWLWTDGRTEARSPPAAREVVEAAVAGREGAHR